MPKEIQDAIGSVALQTEYGLVGGFRLKLDETVVPVVIINDLSQERGDAWRYAFAGDDQALAGAANRHIYSLGNPPGSGKVIQILEFGVGSSANIGWIWVINDPPYVPGTILASSYQNLRGTFLVPASAPSGEFRWAAAAAIPGGAQVLAILQPAVNSVRIRPDYLVLNPGESIQWYQRVLNITSDIYVQWRERPLKTGE